MRFWFCPLGLPGCRLIIFTPLALFPGLDLDHWFVGARDTGCPLSVNRLPFSFSLVALANLLKFCSRPIRRMRAPDLPEKQTRSSWWKPCVREPFF